VNPGSQCEKQQQIKTPISKDGMTLCNISQSLRQVNHSGHCEKQQQVKQQLNYVE
jgi:hypothetical protein